MTHKSFAMNVPIEIKRKNGTVITEIMPVFEFKADHHRFSEQESNIPIAMYFFHHSQHHSRLDLSLLKDHLLVSFDLDYHMVGVGYCGSNYSGPYVVHNKQRTFLLAKRQVLEYPMEILLLEKHSLSFINPSDDEK